jgi:hypothetical protein
MKSGASPALELRVMKKVVPSTCTVCLSAVAVNREA